MTETEAEPERTREGELLVGKYRLEKLLGSGGMGEVYRARNEAAGRTVAIKLLRPEWVTNPEIVARFLREAQAVNLVRHPNVVEVLDVGRDDAGAPFIVQEFLQGQDLSRHLAEKGSRWTASAALQLVLPVLDAIACAHARGVVHRDLKPENVFLTDTDAGPVPKVLDFGISKIAGPESMRMTATGVAMGTPLYMSPEQIQGARDVDARSDVWSLGVMLYEILAGSLPFDGKSQGDLFVRICTEDPPDLASLSPHLPPALSAVVMRCLRRSPAERPADAGELARELRAVLADVDPDALAVVPAPAPPRPSPPRTATDAQTVGLRGGLAVQPTEHARRPPARRAVVASPAGADRVPLAGGMLGAGFVLLLAAGALGAAAAMKWPAVGWPVIDWWQSFAPTLSPTALTAAAFAVCLSAAAVIVQVLRDSPPSLGLILCGAGLIAEGFFLGRAAALGSFASAMVDPNVHKLFPLVAPWALVAVPAGLGFFGLGRALDAWRYRAHGGRVMAAFLLALSLFVLFGARQIARGVLHPAAAESGEDGGGASGGREAPEGTPSREPGGTARGRQGRGGRH